MKLICKTCDLEISKEVSELKDLSLINSNDREDYIPEGFFLINDHDQITCFEQKGAIIINIKDLVNSKRHSNRSRLNGCCGLDGCDGMNRVCLHNHEIGTEKSDCWMPHLVALNPNFVELV